MTLPEFLEKLEQTPRTWYQTPSDGRIRSGTANDYHCPISAACAGELAYPLEAAKKAGMSLSLAEQITIAADSNTFPSELRAKLLKACGLEAQ